MHQEFKLRKFILKLGFINRRAVLLNLLMASLLLVTLLLSLRNISHSLWSDEAFTSEIAHKETFTEIIDTAMKRRPYPPLYFFLVHESIKYSNDEFGLRFPSVIFGILAVMATFLLGKALFDNSIGFIAALLFVSTPGIFRSFVDANAYAMLAFSVTASTYFLYIAMLSQRIRHWMGFIIFSIVSIGTHMFAIFHVIGQIIGAFCLSGSWEPDMPQDSSVGLLKSIHKKKRLVICSLTILVVWIIWIYFYFTNRGLTTPFNFQKIFSAKTFILCPALYFGYLSKGKLIQLILWSVLQLFGSMCCFLENRKKFVFLFILIIVPTFLISFAMIALLPFFAFRYGIGMFPLGCILAACSIRFLYLLTLTNLKRYLTIVLLSLLLIVYTITGFITIFDKNSDLLEIQDWRGAGKYLSSHIKKRDILFFVESWRYLSLKYYFKTPSKLYLVENDKQLIENVKHLFEEQSPGKEKIQRRQFWVVLSSLENKNALIEKFFGDLKIPAKENAKLLIKKLRENFNIESIDVLHFKRISIVQFSAKS